MNIDVRSVHFDLGDNARSYLDKKLERINHAKDSIVDLMFCFTKEKQFKCETTINFRWGATAHIEEQDFDLTAGIDKMMDKVEQKIHKEKEKIKEKK